MSMPVSSQVVPIVTDRGLSAFGHDPVWLVIIKAVLIFVVLVLLTLFNIWFERRVVARMQHRIGPNVNGPFGLLQSLADGTVWAPASAPGASVRHLVGPAGCRVTISGGTR